jgi:uncharacterized membrane protein
MNLYSLIKVLHILAVTAVIAGVVGRALIRARLVRLDDIHIVREFVVLEGYFDQWLVVYGSITTLLTGLLLTWLGRWPLLNEDTPTWTLVGAVLFLATIPLVIWVYIPALPHIKCACLLTTSFTVQGLLRKVTLCRTTLQGECKEDHLASERH